jgi:hypothetical protein
MMGSVVSARGASLIALAALLMCVAVAPAPAVVPPKDCGPMEVSGKRYKIKADQLKCGKARDYALDYLQHGDEPRGYKCQSYGSDTKVKFRCWSGIKEIIGIRRG